MTATFSQFVFLYVLYYFTGSHQSSHLQYLIDRIVANQKRSFFKDLDKA